MASISRVARGNCNAGKIQSPVADAEATGLQTNGHSTTEVTTIADQDREGHELHNKVTELQTTGIVRWNVYESSKNYNRVADEEEWGEWVMIGSHKTEEGADRQIQIREDHNHTVNSRNDYGIVHVRWEKRHELILPANSTVTQVASVTDGEEVKQLQNQVTELQSQVKSLEAKLNLVRKQKNELVEEVTELTQENSGFKNGERYQRILSELRQAQFEIQGLRQENDKNATYDLDNLKEIRDRILSGWKVARRAESKDRIKEALDRFILQLPQKTPANSVTDDLVGDFP